MEGNVGSTLVVNRISRNSFCFLLVHWIYHCVVIARNFPVNFFELNHANNR